MTGNDEIISGRVTDALGNPLPAEIVSARESGGATYQTLTNSRGIYALAHLPSATTYTISVAKPGFGFYLKAVSTGTSVDNAPPSGNVWAVDFILNTIYVDASATGNNDGSSWIHAYNYLQDALAAASVPTVILVAEGIYKPDQTTANPNGSGLRTATFQLISGVAIYGGFPAGGCSSWDERDIDAYETILSGDIGTPDVNSDNSYHVVTGSGTDANALLNGFTITRGRANGPSDGTGAGMYTWQGSFTIANCTFIHNFAQSSGGGMANFYLSYPTLTNCTFIDNSSGMYNRDTSATISNCTYTRNRTYGIGNNYASPKITNCMFSDNPDRGMWNAFARPVVVNSIFTGNTGNGRGAGFSCRALSATIVNCIFTGNVVEGWGGAIGSWQSVALTVVNCLFSGNSATSDGGAIYVHGGTPRLTNCTIAANTANANGGGIYADNCEPNLTNCIVWDNNDISGTGEPAQIHCLGSNPIVTYSCIRDDDPNDAYIPYGGAVNHNIDDNPLFERDPNDGGDGWGNPNDDYGDLLPSPASPCIDVGHKPAVPPDTFDLNRDADTAERTPLDVQGRHRFADGDCNATHIVDMGAHEFAWVYIGDLDGDCNIDFADFAVFAAHWLMGTD